MQVIDQVFEQSTIQAAEPAASLSIRKILLATDFSAGSESAGAYAKAVAKHFVSVLEIVHVFNPAVVTSYEEAIVSMTPAQMKEISDENLQRFASDLHLDGIETELLLTDGHNASSALLQISREHHADLIVAGTEAKKGLSRLILGSTAEQLLRWAACPVLTVGPMAKKLADGPLDFKRIVYATDLSPEAAKAAPMAVAFAEESAAHLYCCCVLNPNDEGLRSREELQGGFIRSMKECIPETAYDWCEPDFVVRYGEAADSILQFAHQVDADLIVLGARRASFWLTRVEGGMTPALLAQARCPVLSIS